MLECSDNPADLCQFPTELIVYILKFLAAKNLIACRRVCRRWREIVDDITSDDHLWEKHCENDFKTLFRDAKKKTSCLHWFDLYRSLSLWCRLSDAKETQDEFCHPSRNSDQIEDLILLERGVVAVRKQISVVYYDISTLEPNVRSTVHGEFVKFVEYDDVLIVLSNHLHLRVMKNWKRLDLNESNETRIQAEDELVFRNVRNVRVFGRSLYFINFDDDIFYCDLDKKLAISKLNRNNSEQILTLSYYNGSLHAITPKRQVYVYQNDKFQFLFNLESKKSNIFDCLWRYEFLGHLEWRIFTQWLVILRITLPECPLRYISMMKVYGDIIFVGCKNGVMLIYYKPFTDGQLDLISHTPVKQYKFTEREDIPVLSLYPIVSVEVLEITSGHKVLVAMPKKIIVLTFINNFEVIRSKAVIPYVPPPIELKV